MPMTALHCRQTFVGLTRELRRIDSPISIFMASTIRILQIIRLGSSIKMVRINASSHIAPMKNMFAFRNFSIVQLVRKFMSSSFSSLKEKLSVSILFTFDRPCPQPASRSFSNEFPKTFFRRNYSKLIMMFSTSFCCFSTVPKFLAAINTRFHGSDCSIIVYVQGT